MNVFSRANGLSMTRLLFRIYYQVTVDNNFTDKHNKKMLPNIRVVHKYSNIIILPFTHTHFVALLLFYFY